MKLKERLFIAKSKLLVKVCKPVFNWELDRAIEVGNAKLISEVLRLTTELESLEFIVGLLKEACKEES